MTPPPSVGTVRPRARTSRGVSRTYSPTCNKNTGRVTTGATVRWARLIVDDERRLLDVVCDAWPQWQTALAGAGLLGCTGSPAIDVEGDDELFVVFTAAVLEPVL